MNRAAARHFPDTHVGWPRVPQADYLAPDGYDVAYRTNAVTREGEHGNALLSRWPLGDVGHHDVSDHRFEQRGLLHVPVHWNGVLVHAIVAHFGLIHSSRVRQVERLAKFIEARCRATKYCRRRDSRLGRRLEAPMRANGLHRRACRAIRPPFNTFPSRMPMFSMTVVLRGMRAEPFGAARVAWARMSDHLPLMADSSWLRVRRTLSSRRFDKAADALHRPRCGRSMR